MRNGRHVVLATLLSIGVAQPAWTQSLDAGFRADIEKLMAATGANNMGTQMATPVSTQMIAAFRKSQPNVPERALQIVRDTLGEEFGRAFDGPDGMRGKLVESYGTHFTHDEVRALLAFYLTDVGRKAVTVMPTLVQEGARAGQEWAAANGPRVGALIDQRLRAEGFLK